MKIKPYRIKHKPTGLYYQPSQDGTNLSYKGKVYFTRKSPLTINDNLDNIWVSVKQSSRVFKKFHSVLGLKEKECGWWYKHILRIPKSEFELEIFEL